MVRQRQTYALILFQIQNLMNHLHVCISAADKGNNVHIPVLTCSWTDVILMHLLILNCATHTDKCAHTRAQTHIHTHTYTHTHTHTLRERSQTLVDAQREILLSPIIHTMLTFNNCFDNINDNTAVVWPREASPSGQHSTLIYLCYLCYLGDYLL